VDGDDEVVVCVGVVAGASPEHGQRGGDGGDVDGSEMMVGDGVTFGKQKFRPAYMLSGGRSKRAGRARRLSSSDINVQKSGDPHQTRVLTASSVAVGDKKAGPFIQRCSNKHVKAAHDNETIFNIMSLKTPMELSIDEKQQMTNSVPYYLDEATGWGLEICVGN
ncbi:hypothetical protein Tco_1332184, partial [Tanacetum coccineum]